MDFLWVDLLFLGLSSCFCGFLLGKRPQNQMIQPLTWILVGGSVYPMLYVCRATYVTHGDGWATSLSMLVMGAGSFFAAWTAGLDNPLFRVAPERTRVGHILRTLLHTCVFWFISLAMVPWLLVQAQSALNIPGFTTPFQYWLPPVGFAGFALLNLTTGYVMSNWGKSPPSSGNS